MCTLMWEGSLDLKTATPDADCVEEGPEWTVSSPPLETSKRRSRHDCLVLLWGTLLGSLLRQDLYVHMQMFVVKVWGWFGDLAQW